jgi:hypothetical protein
MTKRWAAIAWSVNMDFSQIALHPSFGSVHVRVRGRGGLMGYLQYYS